MFKVIASLVLLAALIGVLGAGSGGAPQLDGYERFVHSDGTFRFSWEAARRDLHHLGSWFVPAGEAAGFHHVYTQIEAIEAYRANGEFPDGTALVKEIASHHRAAYTTGEDVASAEDTRQWFLMIKDTRGRFESSPLWGNGWGWALFDSDDPTKNIATDFRRDCLGCHVPAEATDWIYTGGYPALGAQ